MIGRERAASSKVSFSHSGGAQFGIPNIGSAWLSTPPSFSFLDKIRISNVFFFFFHSLIFLYLPTLAAAPTTKYHVAICETKALTF